MEKLIVRGRNRLCGKIDVSSAKNSVLPLMAASVLREGKTYIENCPKICDVLVMGRILRALGAIVSFEGNTLALDTTGVSDYNLPCELTRKIRASLFTVGALLGRFGRATICRPGGCNIGERPIDIHVSAMRDLGVKVKEGDLVVFRDDGGKGGETTLPFPSVGATENLVMLSVLRKGKTIVRNAAREPEIVDLQRFLNLAGAKVSGAGTEEITVEGVERLVGGDVRFRPVADRIEAGTFLFAGIACGGEMLFSDHSLDNLDAVFEIVGQNACKIYRKDGKIEGVSFPDTPVGFGNAVETAPFPGFPTDLHPQLVASSCFCRGETRLCERIFPGRFGYVRELIKAHAGISLCGDTVCVAGGGEHRGAEMVAGDLRGGAALVIAALASEGRSSVSGAEHIDRGYGLFEEKLRALGASVVRAEE
ncbi:MAG: UDP-N-acetylglucosamine 1-carboxyvinyltransferase [Candidatus Borkfalkiaceae bacterium]|nr:UDP-N-acetylglucosamine 1-carboxyvinyltransferase [Christensenellaceae bacterium]